MLKILYLALFFLIIFNIFIWYFIKEEKENIIFTVIFTNQLKNYHCKSMILADSTIIYIRNIEYIKNGLSIYIDFYVYLKFLLFMLYICNI